MIRTCPHCGQRMKHVSSAKDTDINGRKYVRWQVWECPAHGQLEHDKARALWRPAPSTTDFERIEPEKFERITIPNIIYGPGGKRIDLSKKKEKESESS